jgi:hypothetical protein
MHGVGNVSFHPRTVAVTNFGSGNFFFVVQMQSKVKKLFKSKGRQFLFGSRKVHGILNWAG